MRTRLPEKRCFMTTSGGLMALIAVVACVGVSPVTARAGALSAPTVATGPASSVTQSTAVLTGAIDAHSSETTYEFDFGTDTSYGMRIFGDAGFQEGPEAYVSAMQGMAAGVTYHYRIVATNRFGTTYGQDQAFTTAEYSSTAIPVPSGPTLIPTPLIATISADTSATLSKGAPTRGKAGGRAHPVRAKRHRRANGRKGAAK